MHDEVRQLPGAVIVFADRRRETPEPVRDARPDGSMSRARAAHWTCVLTGALS